VTHKAEAVHERQLDGQATQAGVAVVEHETYPAVQPVIARYPAVTEHPIELAGHAVQAPVRPI